MKAIVTGGAGFLGSWLCDALLRRGDGVTCIDSLITGSRENIRNLEKNRRFRFVLKNVASVKSLKKFDVAFHLASPASPKHYQKYPVETMLANSAGTKNLLDNARKHNAKLVFASTSEVYGDPKEHPQKESYWGNVNPLGVRSCYDESKRFGEALCMSYFRMNTSARIARIFNTYGPRMQKDDGRAIPSFIASALRNEDIVVYGNGKQTRSFCYAADMAEGLIKMSEADVAGTAINLGNPDECRIIDAARKIRKLASSSSKIVFTEMPQDDPGRRRPDISLAKSLLGWKPKTGIDEGLKITIGHFMPSRI